MNAAEPAYHNGQFVPRSQLMLSAHDAGFVFGATVTDYCRTYYHRLHRWPQHLARLRRDCAACAIPLLATDNELSAAALHLIAVNSAHLAAEQDLALITFVTPGPLPHLAGDSNADCVPTVAMHTLPIPHERYAAMLTHGARLVDAGQLPTAPDYPHGAKHRSRLHWWLAQQHAEPGWLPVLRTPRGVPDTAIAAVLAVVHGELWHAPPDVVHNSLTLDWILELATSLGLRTVAQADWPETWHDLHATELLLCGTAFGLCGVASTRTGPHTTTYPHPGLVLKRLKTAMTEMDAW
jgi:branched-subunit amino acid aminotransferase/4-amino-4-deoxychorismate lyase